MDPRDYDEAYWRAKIAQMDKTLDRIIVIGLCTFVVLIVWTVAIRAWWVLPVHIFGLAMVWGHWRLSRLGRKIRP